MSRENAKYYYYSNAYNHYGSISSLMVKKSNYAD